MKRKKKQKAKKTNEKFRTGFVHYQLITINICCTKIAAVIKWGDFSALLIVMICASAKKKMLCIYPSIYSLCSFSVSSLTKIVRWFLRFAGCLKLNAKKKENACKPDIHLDSREINSFLMCMLFVHPDGLSLHFNALTTRADIISSATHGLIIVDRIWHVIQIYKWDNNKKKIVAIDFWNSI